jgi:hypothetical protein
VLVARGIGNSPQEIAVARERCAEAHEIASAQFVERAKQVMLVGLPECPRDAC